MEGLEMKYFVLKPRGLSPYAQASREAMRTYAASIEEVNPALASDIRQWITNEFLALPGLIDPSTISTGN